LSKMIELLDLKKKLAYVGFDKLNLKCLDPLRLEVEMKIQRLIKKDECPDCGHILNV